MTEYNYVIVCVDIKAGMCPWKMAIRLVFDRLVAFISLGKQALAQAGQDRGESALVQKTGSMCRFFDSNAGLRISSLSPLLHLLTATSSSKVHSKSD